MTSLWTDGVHMTLARVSAADVRGRELLLYPLRLHEQHAGHMAGEVLCA